MAAYTSGTLTAEEAARVRAMLAYYPELATDSEGDAADEILTDFEVARDRAAVRARLASNERTAWRHLLPVAAALTIAVLSGLLVQSRAQIAALSRESRQPYVHDMRHEIHALHARGAATPPPYELPPGKERYLLALMLPQPIDARELRLDLVDVSTRDEKIVWSATAPRPRHDTLELSIPAELLRRRTYRIDVRGKANEGGRPLESFWIRETE